MQICYLTCGFVDLPLSAGACSPLTEPLTSVSPDNVLALLPSWGLAHYAAKSCKTIISYLDPVKRFEAYLSAEGLPVEPEGTCALLAGHDHTSSALGGKRNARARAMGLVPSHLGAVSDRTGQVRHHPAPVMDQQPVRGQRLRQPCGQADVVRSPRATRAPTRPRGHQQRIQRVVMARQLFKQQYVGVSLVGWVSQIGRRGLSQRITGPAGPGLADHTQAVLSLVIAAVIADSAVPGVSVKDFCRAVISGLRSAFPGTEARWLSAVWSWVR